MRVQLVSKEEAIKIIESHKVTGKVFGVRFVKKDNTVRLMACRFGVKAHHRTNGTPSTVAHISKYVTVFDMKKVEYRNVNVETLLHVVAGQVKYVLA